MNYRHGFHAGGFADVFKHVVLTLTIERLKAKSTPIVFLDSHAGAGIYDLGGAAAQKTGEYRDGILKVLALRQPAKGLAPYLALVRRHNPGLRPDGAGLEFYPGSPQIACDLLRPQDRVMLVELHPAERAELKRRYRRDARVAIHLGDGFHALKGLLPPVERRGIVLVDPPFEKENDFARMVAALKAAYRRWPTGHYLLWYPIKDGPAARRFLEAVAATGIAKILLARMLVRAAGPLPSLDGAAMLVVNPPWRLEAELVEVLPALALCLGQNHGARATIEWLAPEGAAI